MRVLILITRADEIGGAQKHVLDLAVFLKKRDYEIVVAYGMKGDFVNELNDKNIQTVQVPNLKRNISLFNEIKAVNEFRKIIVKFNPDIISCHSTKAGLIGRIAAFREKKIVIFTAHGWAFTDGVGRTKQFFYAIIERFLSKITAAIINVSKYDQCLAIKNGIHCQNYVIHNCIPNRKVSTNKFNNKKVYISVIARFCPQKDHETFIEALSLLDGNLDFQVKFIGGGDSSLIEKMAKKYGISHKLIFMGQINNIAEILDETHIFCLPSNWEGFPISIIEAMRAQCAIISSNVGGVSESIEHLKSGILIDKKDINSWAYHLDNLIKNKSLVEKYASSAREQFENNFNISEMIDKYESIIKKLVI